MFAVNTRAFCFVLGMLGISAGACSSPALRLNPGSDAGAYARDRDGQPPSEDPSSLRFRPGLCDGEDMRPEVALLDESHLVRFLQKQQIDVRVERPRADLVYLNLVGAGTQSPVRVRVAVLKNADEAGLELHQAILQHGTGSWGVHRSNLAVLGPVGSIPDDVTFAAKTKLACWGVFTVAGRDDAFVVAGGYREL